MLFKAQSIYQGSHKAVFGMLPVPINNLVLYMHMSPTLSGVLKLLLEKVSSCVTIS